MTKRTRRRQRLFALTFAAVSLLLYLLAVASLVLLLIAQGPDFLRPLIYSSVEVIRSLLGWLSPKIEHLCHIVMANECLVLIWAVSLLVSVIIVTAIRALILVWFGQSLTYIGVYGNLVIGLFKGVVILQWLLSVKIATPLGEPVLIFLKFVFSFFAGFVPIFGTALAAYAATTDELWEWSPPVALGIFFLPYIAFSCVLAFAYYLAKANMLRCKKHCAESNRR